MAISDVDFEKIKTTFRKGSKAYGKLAKRLSAMRDEAHNKIAVFLQLTNRKYGPE